MTLKRDRYVQLKFQKDPLWLLGGDELNWEQEREQKAEDPGRR